MAGAQKLLLGVLGSVSLFCQDLQLMRCYFLLSLASAKPNLLGAVFMIQDLQFLMFIGKVNPLFI